jgi:hypothetical protein
MTAACSSFELMDSTYGVITHTSLGLTVGLTTNRTILPCSTNKQLQLQQRLLVHHLVEAAPNSSKLASSLKGSHRRGLMRARRDFLALLTDFGKLTPKFNLI